MYINSLRGIQWTAAMGHDPTQLHPAVWYVNILIMLCSVDRCGSLATPHGALLRTAPGSQQMQAWHVTAGMAGVQRQP